MLDYDSQYEIKVMILGAGIYQVPLIQEIKDRGFEVIVASPKGSYPGIPLADVCLDIDIMDTDNIVQGSKEYDIVGIVTMGTDAISSVGAVVDTLSVRGPNKGLVEIVYSKTAFLEPFSSFPHWAINLFFKLSAMAFALWLIFL